MNARIEADGDLSAVFPTGPGPHGVQFLTAFKAGELHTIQFVLKAQSATELRLEAHGSATRMHKAVATIGADGAVLSQAEEVAHLSVQPRPDGATLDVSFAFVPFHSLIEWFYVLAVSAREDVSPNVPLFCAGAFRVSTQSLGLPVKSSAHLPALNVSGTLFVCQNMLVLRNYVHIQVELHKPGTHLVQLDLTTARPIAHVQWWTWNPPRKRWRIPLAAGATRLRAQKPSSPISSPALMDVLGPAFAHCGHVITFVFSDLFDITKLSADAAGKIGQALLHLTFADGSTQTIDLGGDSAAEGGANPWIQLALRSLAELEGAGRTVTFLEAGARGGASAHMRQLMTERGWSYVGVDISADKNVDFVADVHSMAPQVADASVAAVYSSEVMEHLVDPPRFVHEANRVLIDGGLFIARAPTTWPLHAEPWDFWRFSRHAWQGLLNAHTGFEILEVCEYGESMVVPAWPFWSGGVLMSTNPAPLLTGVIARKIASAQPGALARTSNAAIGRYDPA